MVRHEAAIGVLLVVACELAAARSLAHAGTFPEHEITVGPSAAFVTTDAEGGLYGVEFSYLPHGVLWGTVGGRLLDADTGTTGLAHVEAGAWLFAAFGLGYSRRLWGEAFDANNLSFFIGAPVPFAEAFDAGMFLAEPYFRHNRGLANGSVVNVLGLMLNFTTFE